MSLCFNVFAEDVYIKNFSKKNAYTQNQFTDVNSEWFASSVQQAYETGLMYGDSETTFNPNGNIDNAAVITIAARLHSIYNYGTENFNANNSVWYEPYIEYAPITLTIGSDIAYVNGEVQTLLKAPEIINGNTMIPVRFISEQLGMNVK